MNFPKMITSTGSTVHYGAGGTRSLCGREMYREARGVEGTGRICKRCEKSAPAHTEFRERIGFDAPVESAPVKSDNGITMVPASKLVPGMAIANGHDPDMIVTRTESAGNEDSQVLTRVYFTVGGKARSDVWSEPGWGAMPVRSASIPAAPVERMSMDIMVTDYRGDRYAFAAVPNGDPELVELFIREAQRCGNFRDIKAEPTVAPTLVEGKWDAVLRTTSHAGFNTISDAMMERDPEDAPYGPVDASLADRETRERAMYHDDGCELRTGRTAADGYDFPVTVTRKANSLSKDYTQTRPLW